MDGDLRLGMFLAGVLMSLVPISLAIGVGIYVLREYLRKRESDSTEGAKR